MAPICVRVEVSVRRQLGVVVRAQIQRYRAATFVALDPACLRVCGLGRDNIWVGEGLPI